MINVIYLEPDEDGNITISRQKLDTMLNHFYEVGKAEGKARGYTQAILELPTILSKFINAAQRVKGDSQNGTSN